MSRLKWAEALIERMVNERPEYLNFEELPHPYG